MYNINSSCEGKCQRYICDDENIRYLRFNFSICLQYGFKVSSKVNKKVHRI